MTLTGGVLTAVSLGSYHGTREEYRASRCFLGAHIEKPEDFSFRSRTPESQRIVGVELNPFQGCIRINISTSVER